MEYAQTLLGSGSVLKETEDYTSDGKVIYSYLLRDDDTVPPHLYWVHADRYGVANGIARALDEELEYLNELENTEQDGDSWTQEDEDNWNAVLIKQEERRQRKNART